MPEELIKTNQHLIEILSSERGYFGRIDTWGQRPTKYEYIGYELSEEFSPILATLSNEQRKTLGQVMTYFEIHAHPLKKLLVVEGEHDLYKFYSDIAWSHFMTVVMFGMLEIIVKSTKEVSLNKRGELVNKGESIKAFLNKYLSHEIKTDITERYSVDKVFGYNKKIESFSDVIDHLWQQIRCAFVHNAGLESKGLEWSTLSRIGTKENPITISQDVPMQEWLQVTWQAILNFFGYKGILQLPKYKREK